MGAGGEEEGCWVLIEKWRLIDDKKGGYGKIVLPFQGQSGHSLLCSLVKSA